MSISVNRIESTFKKELSYILENAKNDHLKAMTITDIDLTSQKEYARVYFMTHKNVEKTLKEVKRSMAYINKVLSSKLSLKRLPRIEFILDNSYEYGKEIEEKLKNIEFLFFIKNATILYRIRSNR